MLNMFRTLIYPPSGACDYSVELPHWSYFSSFGVCWSFGVVGLEWYPCCRLQPASFLSCCLDCCLCLGVKARITRGYFTRYSPASLLVPFKLAFLVTNASKMAG